MDTDDRQGWVKMYRRIIDNPIFRQSEVYHLFSYLLLRANYEPRRVLIDGREIVIERGQVLTGWRRIFQDTGLTRQRQRTASKRLVSGQIITTKTTNKFSIVTICNYDQYQGQGVAEPTSTSTSTSTTGQPPVNHQLTTGQPPANHKEEVKNLRSKEAEKPRRERENAPSPDHTAFKDFYVKMLKEMRGVDYYPLRKDDEVVEELMLNVPLRELEALLLKFFESEDPWIQESGYGLPVFRSQLQTLRGGGQRRSAVGGESLWLEMRKDGPLLIEK